MTVSEGEDQSMKLTLKMARIGAGLTQQQVADALGIHVQTYARLEKHPEKMKMEQAIRFADLTGVDLSDLTFLK